MRAYSQGRTACQQSTAGRKLVVNHGNATLLILDSVTKVGHPPSKTVCVSFGWIFFETKSRDQFLLEGRKISDSSAVATAPLQQKDANAISPSLGRNSLPCTTRDPTKSGKAGSKDRNTGPVAAQMLLLLSCLGESVEVSGHGGHTSFPALLGRRHTTLSRAYFPCCPRLPATEQHHPVSSTRRLSVKHKHPLSWCTNDYIW